VALEDLGNLGDFIGGLAVVVTLIYLAMQVRHNTAALERSSRQDVVAGFRENLRICFQPGMGATLTRGIRAYPDLLFEEKMAFGNFTADLALFLQSAFALHESGTLEEETYQAYLDFCGAWLATPGGERAWAELKPLFFPRMVAAVDARLAAGGLPELTEGEFFAPPEA
jgi:hypothetical protein